MEHFNLLNVLYYCIFGAFLYYQQLHLRDFRGASKSFEIILSISVFLGVITGLGFLIYYGIAIIWWAPFVLLGVGILFTFVAVFLEQLVGAFIMSIAAFIVWPLMAVLMFLSIPK